MWLSFLSWNNNQLGNNMVVRLLQMYLTLNTAPVTKHQTKDTIWFLFHYGKMNRMGQCYYLYLRRLCERNTDCCHWSWSKSGEKKCWLKTMKLSVVQGSQSNHVSGSKICTNQCEPGVCWEHARYPGGSAGDASMEQVAETFHECRCGK